MTRGELRLAVQQRIADTAGVRATVEELNRYIDDGYQDLAETTGAVVRTDTLACPEGEHYVALPEDCLYPIVAREMSAGQPLDFVDWPLIDKKDTQFIRRTSSYPQVVAMWGLSELLLYPAFSTASTIEITMAIIPGPLGESDSPDIPLQHHQALIHYAHGRVLLKDAHGDVAGPRLGRAKRQMSFYRALSGALDKWAIDRHGTMKMAIYGESFRRHGLEPWPAVATFAGDSL